MDTRNITTVVIKEVVIAEEHLGHRQVLIKNRQAFDSIVHRLDIHLIARMIPIPQKDCPALLLGGYFLLIISNHKFDKINAVLIELVGVSVFPEMDIGEQNVFFAH